MFVALPVCVCVCLLAKKQNSTCGIRRGRGHRPRRVVVVSGDLPCFENVWVRADKTDTSDGEKQTQRAARTRTLVPVGEPEGA